jgi:hypothetical protein
VKNILLKPKKVFHSLFPVAGEKKFAPALLAFAPNHIVIF